MAASMSRKEPPASSPTTSTTNGVSKSKPKPKGANALAAKLATASANTSRTASPAPGEGAPAPSSQPATSSNSKLPPPGIDDKTHSRCKHCNIWLPNAEHSSHSKQCLRNKQEATRRKREQVAIAEAAANGTAVPENISGKLKDGKTKADAKDLRIDTNGEASRSATVGVDGESVLGSAAGSVAGDFPDAKKKGLSEKKGKKRKANAAALDGDTDSIAGSTTGTTTKPPNKKQKKKDTTSENTKDTNTKTKGSSTTNTSGGPGTGGGGGGGGGKPKGPVDVERQCGVILPNGAMCARSLTCKSHPMGAKRAVPGRSLPYDMLLAQWTKKNQAKQQKAAMESNQTRGDGADGADGSNGGPIDSDEETEKVMAGIRRAAPRPLYERVPISIGSRYGVVRVKEVLREAMSGSRGSGLFSLGDRAGARGGGWTASSGAAGDDVQAQHARKVSGVNGQANGRQVSVGPGVGAQDGMRKGSVGLGVSA